MFLTNFGQVYTVFGQNKPKKAKNRPQKTKIGVTFRQYVRFGSFYAPNIRISIGNITVYVGQLKVSKKFSQNFFTFCTPRKSDERGRTARTVGLFQLGPVARE